MKKFDIALFHELIALKYAKMTKVDEKINKAYLQLSLCYSALLNYKNALRYKKLYTTYHDKSVNNKVIEDAVKIESQYEYNKKMTIDSLKSFEKQKLINTQIEGKQKQRFALLACLTLAIIFLIFIAYRLIDIQKKKMMIASQKELVEIEKKKSEDLLLNILPTHTATELKEFGKAKAQIYDNASILFTDFKGFTLVSEKLSAEELVAEIDYYFQAFDRIIEKYNLEKIKTIGDAYLCVGGLGHSFDNTTLNTVNAGLEIIQFVETTKKKYSAINKPYFDIRLGIHTGRVITGVVGLKKFTYDIWGEAVDIAQKMEANSIPGKLNISHDTYLLIKKSYSCTPNGNLISNNNQTIDMYFVS